MVDAISDSLERGLRRLGESRVLATQFFQDSKICPASMHTDPGDCCLAQKDWLGGINCHFPHQGQ
jgi:hypothetical protein